MGGAVTFLHWLTVACLWGVLCGGIMQWYRQAMDGREAKYKCVWMQRRG